MIPVRIRLFLLAYLGNGGLDLVGMSTFLLQWGLGNALLLVPVLVFVVPLIGLIGGLVSAAAVVGGGIAVRAQSALGNARVKLGSDYEILARSIEEVRGKATRADAGARTWSVSLDGRSLTALNELIDNVHGNGVESQRAMSRAQALVEDQAGMSLRGDVGAVRNAVDEASSAIDRYRLSVDELVAFGDRMDQDRASVAASAELLGEKAADIEELVNHLSEQGWELDAAKSDFDRAKGSLGVLKPDKTAFDVLTISEFASSLESEMVRIENQLGDIGHRVDVIANHAGRLVEHVRLQQQRTQAAMVSFGELEGVHAPESWDWAGNKLDQAADVWAQSAGAAAGVRDTIASARSVGELDHLDAEVARVDFQANEAQALVEEVETLIGELGEAKSTGVESVNEVRVKLDRFVEYLGSNRQAMSDRMLAKPNHLELALGWIDKEAERPIPNYIRIRQSCDALGDELDGLMVEAASQTKARDELIKQVRLEVGHARSMMRDARSALGWRLLPSRHETQLDALASELARIGNLEPQAALKAARSGYLKAARLYQAIINSRNKR